MWLFAKLTRFLVFRDILARLRAISVSREGLSRTYKAHRDRLMSASERVHAILESIQCYSGIDPGQFPVENEENSLSPLSAPNQSPIHGDVHAAAHMRSTPAAQSASAVWCSITTRRGDARHSQLAVFICASWSLAIGHQAQRKTGQPRVPDAAAPCGY